MEGVFTLKLLPLAGFLIPAVLLACSGLSPTPILAPAPDATPTPAPAPAATTHNDIGAPVLETPSSDSSVQELL